MKIFLFVWVICLQVVLTSTAWSADVVNKCPKSPKGIVVDPNRCYMDDDFDHVMNYRDLCPLTPRGVLVDGFGCPLDDDQDGVGNRVDLCPHTPRGVPVNGRGCWKLKLTILFDAGRSELNPRYYKKLDQVAAMMAPGLSKMEIQGHTDNQMKESYFPGLDKRRAQAVADYLIYRGVKPESLLLVSYGADKPRGDNKTPAGQTINNRVELHPR